MGGGRGQSLRGVRRTETAERWTDPGDRDTGVGMLRLDAEWEATGPGLGGHRAAPGHKTARGWGAALSPHLRWPWEPDPGGLGSGRPQE